MSLNCWIRSIRVIWFVLLESSVLWGLLWDCCFIVLMYLQSEGKTEKWHQLNHVESFLSISRSKILASKWLLNRFPSLIDFQARTPMISWGQNIHCITWLDSIQTTNAKKTPRNNSTTYYTLRIHVWHIMVRIFTCINGWSLWYL